MLAVFDVVVVVCAIEGAFVVLDSEEVAAAALLLDTEMDEGGIELPSCKSMSLSVITRFLNSSKNFSRAISGAHSKRSSNNKSKSTLNMS